MRGGGTIESVVEESHRQLERDRFLFASRIASFLSDCVPLFQEKTAEREREREREREISSELRS